MSVWKLVISCSFFCFFSYSFSLDYDDEIVYFSQYVDSVVKNLPDIQLNKLKYLDSQVKYFKAMKSKEWMWELRGGAFQESDFTGNIDSPFVFQTGWEVSSSINKTFLSLGGRMNLDFVYRQFSARGIVDGITEEREFFVPTLTLKYVQPLLKNAFGFLDRLPLSLSGLESKIAEWTAEEENAYILSNYKKLYMQWIVYAQVRKFLMESYKNAQDLESISSQQKKTGYVDDIILQNSRILVLQVEKEMMDVDNSFSNIQKQIIPLVGRTNIYPDLSQWIIFKEAISRFSFDEISFTNTRQSLILDFINEKIKHSMGALKNSRLPELNILLSTAMQVYSTNSAAQVNQMLIVPAFYTGLQMKYPFGDIDYKANSIDLYKNRQEYEYLFNKYEKEFEYKLVNQQKNIEFYRDKIDNREKTGDVLSEKYSSQYNKFIQGRESMASLIDTKNSILRNRIESADVQLRLIFEYFDYLVFSNKDEISEDSKREIIDVE